MPDQREHLPSTSTYRSRLGTLVRAYERVGFATERDYRYIEKINRTLARVHANLTAETIIEIQGMGGQVRQSPSTDLLTLNEEFTSSIVIARFEWICITSTELDYCLELATCV